MDILQHVLPYASKASHFFVASVCQSWRHAWFLADRSYEISIYGVAMKPARLEWVRGDKAFVRAVVREGGILCLAVKLGNFIELKRAVSAMGTDWAYRRAASGVTRAAAEGGQLMVLEWARG